MDTYIYQAALWCEDCGLVIRERLKHGTITSDTDETEYDSDDYPKGPYLDGGGEADSPQHCDGCGVFLENPLTSDGYLYVMEQVSEDIETGRMDSPTIVTWAPFYDVELPEFKVGDRVTFYLPNDSAPGTVLAWRWTKHGGCEFEIEWDVTGARGWHETGDLNATTMPAPR